METLINNLFQRVPINEISIPPEIDAEKLLSAVTEISIHNPFYIRSFLSSKLFKDPSIDQDEFYDFFSTLLSSKPKDCTETDIIKYNVDGIHIKIKELPRLISGSGTTGLRTWEAALYLSHFLVTEYKSKLVNQKVLELGAGTGLVSLAIIKGIPDFHELIITDGDSNLIESLSHNFNENEIQLRDNSKLRCQTLWWGRDQVPDADIVLAADVTYDASIVPYLVSCIHEALQGNTKEALIAATIRNEDTIKTFEEEVIKKGLKWEIISRAEKPWELKQTLWYPRTSPEIRIYRVVL